jgi:hypothetical protein
LLLVLRERASGLWESGKPAFGFPLFHPLSPAAGVECGNREAIFEGLWKAVCAFHQAVISTGKVLFGRRFGLCCELLDAYLFVENADALHAEYAANAVEFARELANMPWHSREFVVKDCDGRLLAFGSNL